MVQRGDAGEVDVSPLPELSAKHLLQTCDVPSSVQLAQNA